MAGCGGCPAGASSEPKPLAAIQLDHRLLHPGETRGVWPPAPVPPSSSQLGSREDSWLHLWGWGGPCVHRAQEAQCLCSSLVPGSAFPLLHGSMRPGHTCWPGCIPPELPAQPADLCTLHDSRAMPPSQLQADPHKRHLPPGPGNGLVRVPLHGPRCDHQAGKPGCANMSGFTTCTYLQATVLSKTLPQRE